MNSAAPLDFDSTMKPTGNAEETYGPTPMKMHTTTKVFKGFRDGCLGCSALFSQIVMAGMVRTGSRDSNGTCQSFHVPETRCELARDATVLLTIGNVLLTIDSELSILAYNCLGDLFCSHWELLGLKLEHLCLQLYLLCLQYGESAPEHLNGL